MARGWIDELVRAGGADESATASLPTYPSSVCPAGCGSETNPT